MLQQIGHEKNYMGADTTGAFDDDNAVSLYFNIWLHRGFKLLQVALLILLGTAVTQANRAVGISSLFDSTDRTFFITGVQLEAGQNPTTFEHEPFGVTQENVIDIFTKLQINITEVMAEYNAAGYCDVQFPTDMRAVLQLQRVQVLRQFKTEASEDVNIYVLNAYPSWPQDSTFDAEL